MIESYPGGKQPAPAEPRGPRQPAQPRNDFESRGGRRKGAGRKATGRVSVMVRMHPQTKAFLDERHPVPRGHIIDELVKIAQEAIA